MRVGMSGDATRDVVVGSPAAVYQGENMNKVLSGRAAGIALAATVAVAVASLGAGTAHAAPPRVCGTTAVFHTEIQWGGTAAPWHPDANLTVALKNRHIIVDKNTAPT